MERQRIAEILKNAMIKGKSRWSNSPYLARIIFTELIDGDTETTGYGISLEMCDNQNDIYFVDTNIQEIQSREEDGTVIKTWTFDEFIK